MYLPGVNKTTFSPTSVMSVSIPFTPRKQLENISKQYNIIVPKL